jgi:hypothetical protein
MPVIKLSRVDLPLPDGPLIANKLNRGTLKLTSSMMRCPVAADPIKRVRCLAMTRLPRDWPAGAGGLFAADVELTPRVSAAARPARLCLETDLASTGGQLLACTDGAVSGNHPDDQYSEAKFLPAGLAPGVGVCLVLRVILAVALAAYEAVTRRWSIRPRPSCGERRGVLDAGQIRLRWTGHQIRAECEIVVAPDISVVQAHEITVAAEHALLHAIPRLSGALVHADPRVQCSDPHHVLDDHRHASAPAPAPGPS